MKIELTIKKLLGYRISATQDGKIGAKLGNKAGLKAGTKG